jgi:hypothetical protein
MAKPISREFIVLPAASVVVCFKSETFDCVVVDPNVTGGREVFLTPTEPTNFHDAELVRCTDEINRVLGGVLAKDRNHDRHLSMLLTDRGPMLAWVESGADKDDSAAMARALNIEN